MAVTDLIENQGDGIYTTPLFWECNCMENYIHVASQETCPACNSHREDAPDARVNDIFIRAHEFDLPKEFVSILTSAAELTDPWLATLATGPF